MPKRLPRSSKPTRAKRADRGDAPAISRAQHTSSALPALSEVEFGLVIATRSFERWMSRCMAAAGVDDMGPLDILVLHTVSHRRRPKKLADICLILNIEDTHTVTYAIGKLEKLGLVITGRIGKEKSIAITPDGSAVVQRYSEVRDVCLVDGLAAIGGTASELGNISRMLRVLSGHYDQAARSAASL